MYYLPTPQLLLSLDFQLKPGSAPSGFTAVWQRTKVKDITYNGFFRQLLWVDTINFTRSYETILTEEGRFSGNTEMVFKGKLPTEDFFLTLLAVLKWDEA